MKILIMALIGMILAEAGVGVLDHWEAWAVIILAAINGAIK